MGAALPLQPLPCSTVVVRCPTLPSQQIETKIQFREIGKNEKGCRVLLLIPRLGSFRIHIPVAFSNLSPLVAVLDAFSTLSDRPLRYTAAFACLVAPSPPRILSSSSSWHSSSCPKVSRSTALCRPPCSASQVYFPSPHLSPSEVIPPPFQYPAAAPHPGVSTSWNTSRASGRLHIKVA